VSSHYQSYTTALIVTVAVSCFLLLPNILIFADLCHQRNRGGSGGYFVDKKKEELAEAGNCSSSSGDRYKHSKHALVDHVVLSASQQHLHLSASAVAIELSLQEFKTLTWSGTKTMPNCISAVKQPPIYTPSENTEASVEEEETQSPPLPPYQTSPSIPDPSPTTQNITITTA
jgi:hypothetical protein